MPEIKTAVGIQIFLKVRN